MEAQQEGAPSPGRNPGPRSRAFSVVKLTARARGRGVGQRGGRQSGGLADGMQQQRVPGHMGSHGQHMDGSGAGQQARRSAAVGRGRSGRMSGGRQQQGTFPFQASANPRPTPSGPSPTFSFGKPAAPQEQPFGTAPAATFGNQPMGHFGDAQPRSTFGDVRATAATDFGITGGGGFGSPSDLDGGMSVDLPDGASAAVGGGFGASGAPAATFGFGFGGTPDSGRGMTSASRPPRSPPRSSVLNRLGLPTSPQQQGKTSPQQQSDQGVDLRRKLVADRAVPDNAFTFKSDTQASAAPSSVFPFGRGDNQTPSWQGAQPASNGFGSGGASAAPTGFGQARMVDGAVGFSGASGAFGQAQKGDGETVWGSGRKSPSRGGLGGGRGWGAAAQEQPVFGVGSEDHGGGTWDTELEEPAGPASSTAFARGANQAQPLQPAVDWEAERRAAVASTPAFGGPKGRAQSPNPEVGRLAPSGRRVQDTVDWEAERQAALSKTHAFGGSPPSRVRSPSPTPEMATSDDGGGGSALGSQYVIGRCTLMCPARERDRRQRQRDVSMFERADPSVPDVTTSNLAVKKYARKVNIKKSDEDVTDSDDWGPSDVRTLSALQTTMQHLRRILDKQHVTFATIHKFLWDRHRSVRQDLSVQNMEHEVAGEIIMETVRFAVMADHEVADEGEDAMEGGGAPDTEAFSANLNIEQLTKAMTTLGHICDKLKKAGTPAKFEAELRAYMLLLRMAPLASHHPGKTVQEFTASLRRLSPEVQASSTYQHALSIYNAFMAGNYIRFFKLVRKAPYLLACAAYMHFATARTRLLEKYINACTAGRSVSRFALEDMAECLALNSLSEARELCTTHGLAIDYDTYGQEYVLLDKAAFTKDTNHKRYKSEFISSKALHPLSLNLLPTGQDAALLPTHSARTPTIIRTTQTTTRTTPPRTQLQTPPTTRDTPAPQLPTLEPAPLPTLATGGHPSAPPPRHVASPVHLPVTDVLRPSVPTKAPTPTPVHAFSGVPSQRTMPTGFGFGAPPVQQQPAAWAGPGATSVAVPVSPAAVPSFIMPGMSHAPAAPPMQPQLQPVHHLHNSISNQGPAVRSVFNMSSPSVSEAEQQRARELQKEEMRRQEQQRIKREREEKARAEEEMRRARARWEAEQLRRKAAAEEARRKKEEERIKQAQRAAKALAARMRRCVVRWRKAARKKRVDRENREKLQGMRVGIYKPKLKFSGTARTLRDEGTALAVDALWQARQDMWQPLKIAPLAFPLLAGGNPDAAVLVWKILLDTDSGASALGKWVVAKLTDTAVSQLDLLKGVKHSMTAERTEGQALARTAFISCVADVSSYSLAQGMPHSPGAIPSSSAHPLLGNPNGRELAVVPQASMVEGGDWLDLRCSLEDVVSGVSGVVATVDSSQDVRDRCMRVVDIVEQLPGGVRVPLLVLCDSEALAKDVFGILRDIWSTKPPPSASLRDCTVRNVDVDATHHPMLMSSQHLVTHLTDLIKKAPLQPDTRWACESDDVSRVWGWPPPDVRLWTDNTSLSHIIHWPLLGSRAETQRPVEPLMPINTNTMQTLPDDTTMGLPFLAPPPTRRYSPPQHNRPAQSPPTTAPAPSLFRRLHVKLESLVHKSKHTEERLLAELHGGEL